MLANRSMIEWTNDYIAEHAYLVERHVRLMAIVGHVEANDQCMMQAASRLEIATAGAIVIPFVVARRDGWADGGFASAQWVVELYEWIMRSGTVPIEHQHRIRGMLLGYGVDAIRSYDERICGRRFTLSA